MMNLHNFILEDAENMEKWAWAKTYHMLRHRWSFNPSPSYIPTHMDKMNKHHEAEKDTADGGEVFYKRKPEDITGTDGEIVFNW